MITKDDIVYLKQDWFILPNGSKFDKPCVTKDTSCKILEIEHFDDEVLAYVSICDTGEKMFFPLSELYI